MNLSVGDRVGKYEVKKHLGDGSFGFVYLMTDILLNREVAVKFVPNQDPAKFVEHYEAQILNQCRHGQIVGVNGVDVTQLASIGWVAVIDMEYCAEGSVQDLLQKGCVSIRRALKIMIDVLYGLEHAHRLTILHRDLKPANFMVSATGYKLSDFGLAKSGIAGSGAGSPLYMAPEVFSSNTTNFSTEVFSAGMCLYQLCNNFIDFASMIPSQQTIKSGGVIRLLGYQEYVPTRLKTICNRACNVDPAKRYSSVSEMKQALEKLQVGQDWVRIGVNHWEATVSPRKKHELVGTKNFESSYLVNGRRKNSACKPFSDLLSMNFYQEQYVAKNTLR